MPADPLNFIVIGGGAAGFFAAIAAAEQGAERVLILEKGKEVLGKVRISGGGRCNVTHAAPHPRELVRHYPRGWRSLQGPFHRFNARHTMRWFEARGVELKTEADGRMFPTTDSSQTIIDCLTHAAEEAGVEVRTRCKVTGLQALPEGGYELSLADGSTLRSAQVLIATGGLRGAEGRRLVEEAGHGFTAPVPSLFTFHIDDERLRDLQGVSVPDATVKACGITESGPVLITHWGLSGPGILRLSAWGARELADCDYRCELTVNWTGSQKPEAIAALLTRERQAHGKRTIRKRSLVEGITARFWDRLCAVSGISEGQTWANLTKEQSRQLVGNLTAARFAVTGKSTNKDEFVTCGGVPLKDLVPQTMASKSSPGLYFAGEVLDVDGITGGFNFQNAWTTGYLVGSAVASNLQGTTEDEG
ncbi:NAD(P)/FAD-dependent oxidoreductase [Roseibacillus ishigakijimensis]|uniref:NAD(P)/FAD-dependent oxidoreductase n=1 Tax=Roseibacillus ishigakijimensis TaxID=454146 RepID=A0A934VM17_9BACT|nr:NAD(P)/FAD-dependent oxidoreductase [Roseibacillus ishigakijimensis]MBK1833656.1 NAD(P)/FAD-dependent oxidoreductase [Roseibacillus ishigakijimensis]